MTARRVAVTLGMAAGLVLLGPVSGAAWAEDASPPSDGSTSSGGGTTGDPGTADPGSSDPAAGDPSAEDPKPEEPAAGDPTGEEPAPDDSTGEEPPAEPEENVSDSPSEDDAAGGGEPVDACGTVGPDGVDPCILYATGAGLPEGAVEKDVTTAGGGTLGAGAAQLPRTGDETVLLALAGLGLVVLGSASVAAGRPRRTR